MTELSQSKTSANICAASNASHQPAIKTPTRRITKQMILLIILFSSFITIFATSIQIYLDYKTELKWLDQKFQQIEATQLSSLIASVWVVDEKLIQLQLQGLANIPDFEQLSISGVGITGWSIGKQTSTYVTTHELPLVYNDLHNNQTIGTLKIVASLDAVYNRLAKKLLVILVNNAIKTFLVAIFIFYLFGKLITRHLSDIADYVRDLKITSDVAPLKLDRPHSTSAGIDELDDVVDGINAMKQDITLSFETIRQSEHRFQELFGSIPASVIVIDNDYNIIDINSYHLDNFADSFKTRDEYIGKNILSMPTLVKAGLVDVYKHTLDKNPFIALGLLYTLQKNNKPFYYNLRCVPVIKNGQVDGAIIIHEDITDIKLTESAARSALAEAEQANQIKSDFLATMSHEFRTPLNAILGFSELIQGEYFGPLGSNNYTNYINDIHQSGEHLLALVNDILDLSIIEAGKRRFIKENIDIAGLLKNSVVKVTPQAQQKNIHLTCSIPEPLPNLYADKRSIYQILFNILSNAIKFTNTDGDISVNATADKNKLIIVVKDNGIGIAPDQLSRVTEAFTQSTLDPHLAQQGTGLGLTIVKSLIDAQNGLFDIQSTESAGTTVTITLPCPMPVKS